MTLTDTIASQVAVVTGGSKGIGYNIAKALIARGNRVIIGDILDKDGKAAVEEFNANAGKTVAAFAHADVTKYKDIQSMFDLAEKEFGGVDILIANAGIFSINHGLAPFDELDDSNSRIFDVNVSGVIKCNKAALMYMGKRGQGIIINSASAGGIYPTPGMCDYAATKHAVVGWTRSLAQLPNQCNVRVNAVCPTWVETDLISDGRLPKEFRDFIDATPKARMEDVVKAYLQCIDDKSLSGTTLSVLPDGIHIEEPVYRT
ncbi:hypothetical protein BDA99DRAFT_326439 [Phascolomyces articulosus]|uniref:NAD(P)-binding protein n=1 Tax=Phascolomyces articulosus TaxID=60185 RepID=A0AAD5PH09_9FUNG|nr:hypothetical protein BDA99DRAFT_326439 [Phascolomyces articulosus]